jgi:hypothetical protein
LWQVIDVEAKAKYDACPHLGGEQEKGYPDDHRSTNALARLVPTTRDRRAEREVTLPIEPYVGLVLYNSHWRPDGCDESQEHIEEIAFDFKTVASSVTSPMTITAPRAAVRTAGQKSMCASTTVTGRSKNEMSVARQNGSEMAIDWRHLETTNH